MRYSRRESLAWLSGLLALPAFGAAASPLPSRIFRFSDLPVHGAGATRTRPVLAGETHTGFHVELHETDLAPGARPHPPHHHRHEEIFLIREGRLEVTIANRSVVLGPGGVAYVASNQEHGVRNPGPAHAQYFVLALGTDAA